MSADKTELATLGGGCFWCLEAVFQQLPGVASIKSGYAGGHTPNPTYEQVCAHTTGHAEVVQVTFDPAELSYTDLLGVFFATHDPTTRDRQGGDVGPQYRSIILTHSAEQAAAAHEALSAARDNWDDPIVTEIKPLEKFWPAELMHDDYYARNPQNPYCAAVIAPKVAKARKVILQRLARA